MDKVRHRSVVQQVQDTDASKRLAHDVCQDRVGRVQVHRRKSAKDVIQLCQGIDDHEYVACLEVRCVPEHHPARNAEISHGIEWAEIHHGVHGSILKCGLVIGSPQAPQPGKLEQLLWEEEACDEEGLRRPE